MGFLLALSTLYFFSFVQKSWAVYYRDRIGQPHFNPEAHGLPLTESYDDMSWSEIFADEVKEMMNREKMAKPLFMKEDVFNGHFEVDHDWPNDGFPVGEIGGLDIDGKGHLHILHRANRVWAPDSFNESNIYQTPDRSTIKKPTIMVINISDGSIINHWGNNLFILPHGIELDSNGNTFVTDVALHQVFKFGIGNNAPQLTLGKAFEPASSNDDDHHFCMPTDVAAASNGDFFVSDGYCASRVMKFDLGGNLLHKFGMDDSNIPHGLALAEDLDLLCVADREGMRVLCYKAGIKNVESTGNPVVQFTDEEFGRVYGITYSPTDGLLYGILGRTGILKSQGFSVDLKDSEAYERDVIAYWSPDDEGFTSPHAIALSKDGGNIFIGEIAPNYIWKFDKDI